MRTSAYDTTLLSGVKLAEIKNALEGYFAREGMGGTGSRFLEHPRTKTTVPAVELLPSPHEIHPFAHPLTIERSGGFKMLVMDVRNFTRCSQNGEVTVTSQLDYTTLRYRTFAELATWVDPHNLFSIGSLHTTVFTRWVADAVGRRLGLPPETQVRLTILTGLYYVNLMLGFGDKIDEREKVKTAQIISKATFIPVEDVLRVIDPIEHVGETAFHLIELLKSHGESVRFDQLNIGLLYNILYMGSWFGANKNELISLALEHPPTFIGMVLAACEERGYRKTAIGDLIKSYDKNGAAEAMVKVFWHLPMPN